MKNRILIYLVVITGLITATVMTISFYECKIVEAEKVIFKNQIEIMKLKNKNRTMFCFFNQD